MDFVPFPKVPRLSRECVITEKIDGTNASVTICGSEDISDWNKIVYTAEDKNTYILAGSRKRFITPQDDNYGFAKWVLANAEELILGLGYGTHFGEWWGQGIQRGYDMDKKVFSLFNTGLWNEETTPPCCSVVPVLYEGLFSTDKVKIELEYLGLRGSKAAPGYDNPEGVMVFHKAANQMFKKTFDDGHKG
jgi:hypothetical protein